MRTPFENLLEDVATLCKFPAGAVVAVGETSQTPKTTSRLFDHG